MLRVRIDPVALDDRIKIAGQARDERREVAVAYARRGIDDALRRNAEVLEEFPEYEVTVDGRRGAPLEDVNPDAGSIIVEFDLLTTALQWIASALLDRSPVKTGDYKRSHTLFVDGVAVSTLDVLAYTEIPFGEVYSFVNTISYARKLEIGKDRRGGPFLKQVPNRIYQRVARDARRRFSKLATIRFTYTDVSDHGTATRRRRSSRWGLLFPMIIVTPR